MHTENITLSFALSGLLAKAASEAGLDPQALAEKAVRDLLTDLQDLREAEAILAKAEPTYTHAQVKKICDLDS